MKKIFSGLLVFILSCSLLACDSSASETTKNSNSETKKEEPKKKEVKEESKKEEIKYEITDKVIESTTNTLKADTLVKDVAIVVKGKQVTIAIQVNGSVNEKKSKDLIDTALRQIALYTNSKPTKNYLGEVWDYYNVEARVFVTNDKILKDASKQAKGALKYK